MMISNNDDNGDAMFSSTGENVHWNFSNLDDIQI